MLSTTITAKFSNPKEDTELFKCILRRNIQQKCEALAKLIFLEHLSFSFNEKVDFVDYYQEALNPTTQ